MGPGNPQATQPGEARGMIGVLAIAVTHFRAGLAIGQGEIEAHAGAVSSRRWSARIARADCSYQNRTARSYHWPSCAALAG